MIANGGGYVYAPLGPTHQATEDLAVMRALPNMTVVAPCDADEMARLMSITLQWPHPIYIRLAKGGDKIVSRSELGFQIGKGISMEGEEILIISTGIMLQRAFQIERIYFDMDTLLGFFTYTLFKNHWIYPPFFKISLEKTFSHT